jgi:hypothetical protein
MEKGLENQNKREKNQMEITKLTFVLQLEKKGKNCEETGSGIMGTQD